MKERELKWKVHLPGLLKEITRNPECAILRIPLQITASLLAAIADRASKLNDPRLNELMARLTLYEITDPYSKDHDPKKTDELMHGKKQKAVSKSRSCKKKIQKRILGNRKSRSDG